MRISIDRLERVKKEGFKQIAQYLNGNFYGNFYYVKDIDTVIGEKGSWTITSNSSYCFNSYDILWDKVIMIYHIKNEMRFNDFLKKYKRKLSGSIVNKEGFLDERDWDFL